MTSAMSRINVFQFARVDVMAAAFVLLGRSEVESAAMAIHSGSTNRNV